MHEDGEWRAWGDGSVLGSGVEAKVASWAEVNDEAQALPSVIGDTPNPAHDEATVPRALVTDANLTPKPAAMPAKCVSDPDVSDVPSANSVAVDPKALTQEQALEVQYWEEVKQMQLRDVECCEWVQKVKAGEEVSKDGGEFELDDAGVLHLRDRQGRLRLVIPPGQPREELLRLVHENPRDGGHFGAVKGAAKLQQRWWWPGMVADLRHWVSTCRLCQVYKHARGRGRLPRDTPRIVPSGPWDSVYVDAIGPLPVGRGGYQYCLVAIDHFTRYVEVLPTRRLTTESYVGWLQQLVSRYGTMRRLTSDRGSNFVSTLVESYCKVMGIERHSTTAWRPTANALVERYNGDLKDRMRTLSQEVGREWPSVVDDFAGVHNCTVHSATGFTPFFLMHGWEARLPYDLLTDGKQRAVDEPVEVQDWVQRFVTLVSDARSAARERQGHKMQERQLRAELVARTINPPPVFHEGQLVLVDKRHKNKGEKKGGHVLWTGPYRVLRKISAIVYLIEREGGREDVVHVDRLKRFKSPRTDSSSLTQRSNPAVVPVPAGAGAEGDAPREAGLTGFEDVDGVVGGSGQSEAVVGGEQRGETLPDEDVRAQEEAEGSYEVEALLEKRILARQTPRGEPQVEYLVKWKHWPDTENQWVPRATLEGSATELLRDFEETERTRARAIRARKRAVLREDSEARRPRR